MVSLKLFLVAISCVVVTIDSAAVPQGNLRDGNCNSAYYGSITGKRFDSPVVILSPGIRTWDVHVQQPPQCVNMHGAVVTACDYDVAPVVTMNSLTEAIVQRMGRLQGTGEVKTVVFCDGGY